MKKLFAAIVVALSVAACGPQVPPIPQVLGDAAQQQAAPAQQSSGISPLGAGLLGAAGGYFAGKAMSGHNNGGTHTVIERERPVYNNGNSYARPGYSSTTTTVTKKGMFGGTKTITRTTRTRR
jgi:hypothetical protein